MTEPNALNDVDKLVLAGIRLGAFEDRLGRTLLRLYRHGILDSWVVGSITGRVNRKLREEAFSTIPFQMPRLRKGDLILGFDEQGNPVCAPFQWMNAGSLTVANTGSGKTTLACFHAAQMAHRVRGMWLTDVRKREFRLLRPELAKQRIDLTVVRSRKYRVNPMQVARDTDPREYASVLSDTLVKVLNLPPRAAVLLTSTMVKLYEEYGIFRGGRKYPTLFHLFDAVRKDRGANAQARQAILDNLEAVLVALGPDVLGYYRGWPVDELAKMHMVFELTGQSEAGKDLILNYLVLSEFISRVSRGISNPGMDLWMNIDEGQRLFSQKKESAGHSGNSITDLAGLVRGAGIGLYVSVLTPDDLSSRIPSLTSTRIIGRCGSVGEYTEAGRFMGLTADQIMWCVHHMVPGLFVGQVSEGSWRYPFLFRIPKLNKLRPVSDWEADESLKSLANLQVEPVEFATWSAVPSVTVVTDAQDKPCETQGLGPGELRLLQAVVNYPMRSSSEYVKLAQISPNTLRKLRPILIEKGFIREHVLEKSGRGRGARIWEPLEPARRAVAGDTSGAGS